MNHGLKYSIPFKVTNKHGKIIREQEQSPHSNYLQNKK